MLRKIAPRCLVVLLIGVAPVFATVVIPHTFDELVTKADTIFVGRVVDRRSLWEETRSGRNIITLVTFSVERVLKGQVGAQTQLSFVGGTIGEVTFTISDMPDFPTNGERDVLFVTDRGRPLSPIVGFSQGRFRIERDPVSGVDQVRTSDGRPLVNVQAVGRQPEATLRTLRAMPFSEFEAAVRQTLARTRIQ
jgi:hypothetical protein